MNAAYPIHTNLFVRNKKIVQSKIVTIPLQIDLMHLHHINENKFWSIIRTHLVFEDASIYYSLLIILCKKQIGDTVLHVH